MNDGTSVDTPQIIKPFCNLTKMTQTIFTIAEISHAWIKQYKYVFQRSSQAFNMRWKWNHQFFHIPVSSSRSNFLISHNTLGLFLPATLMLISQSFSPNPEAHDPYIAKLNATKFHYIYVFNKEQIKRAIYQLNREWYIL